MKRLTVAVLALSLFFSGVTVADTHGGLDVGPGIVGPADPVYGVEVAMDNAAVSVGLAQAGGVAQERAAEASVAAANDNPRAAARAAEEAGNVAQRAESEQDAEGIDKAMASLHDTIAMMENRAENAPNEQARQGMLTASENMRGALNHMEEAQQNRQNAQERSS